MARVHLEMEIAAPVEVVFEKLTDHAAYQRFPGIDRSSLVRRGEADENGLGAIRELRAGLVFFREEIVGFDPPRRYDYLIRETNLPLAHKSGSVTLSELGPGRTHVCWESDFEMTLPIVGSLVGPFAAFTGDRAFRTILMAVKRELEAKTRGATAGS